MENQLDWTYDLDGHAYLNCAYMGPMASNVVAAGHAGIHRKAAPFRITPEHFFEHREACRAAASSLINAPSAHHIALIPAASYGLATVAQNLKTKPGQKLLVVGHEMPSNYHIWKRLGETKGLELQVITPPTEDLASKATAWNESILTAIDDRTAAIAIGQVHWLDGCIFDLEAVAKQTKQVGAALVIDGTQSVGAVPIDVQQLQPDALIVAGYKWLLGPYSTGFAYFSKELQEGVPLEENWINRKDSHDFANLIDYQDQYLEGARRYDVGESSNFILAPMLAQALQNALDVGVCQIQKHCGDLTNLLRQHLEELPVSYLPKDQASPHFLGIQLPEEWNKTALLQWLAEHQVSVSVRGHSLRVTPHIYNTAHHIHRFTEALGGFAAKV